MPKSPLIRKHLNFHYAWVVLTCSMVLIVLSAVVRQSFGVFIEPLVTAHGWSRGSVSLAYAIAFLCASVSSFGLGSLCERLGARRILLAGVVSFSIGVVLLGTVTALWQLYLYYGLLCGGVGFLMNIVIPVTLTRWFAKGAGFALGLMWASIGIGGLFGPVALSWLINSAGWRDTFLLVGTGLGCVMLLAGYFIRNHPQDKDMLAYGDEEPAHVTVDGVENDATPSLAQEFDFGQIKRSPVFWHLINTHFLGCVGHSVLLAHVVSIAILKGIPELKAAGILGTISATSIISRFFFPILSEKFGGKKTLVIAFIMQATPILFLFPAANAWSFYAVAFFFGLGLGGEMPCFPLINMQYWGPRSPLNIIYAWELAGGLLGMALGGWLGGALYDLTGTYTLSIATAFLFSAAGLAPVLALPRHRSGVILSKSTVIKSKGAKSALEMRRLKPAGNRD
jgi:MFS family permease